MTVEKMPNLIPMGEPFVLRTTMAREKVTEAVVLSRIRNAQMATGETVKVQIMTRNADRLLAEAEYRIIARSEELHVRDIDGYQTRQEMRLEFAIRQVGEWWIADEQVETDEQVDPPKRGPGRPRNIAVG